MGSFLISELSAFDWVCEARGTALASPELKFNDRDHGDAEPDRDIAIYAFDQVEQSQLRCACGSTVRAVPK